jgi:hypothetical protein
MKPKMITLPELGLISGTRAMAGAGLALLLADKLNPDQRRAVGWTLLAVGALTTIPLVAEVMLRPDADRAYNVAAEAKPEARMAFGRI